MAYHLGDIKDMEDFKQKIQKQKKFKNKTLKAVKKYLPKEDIKFLEVQMDSEYLESTPDVEIKNEPLMIETQIKPVFMNNYERYEWFIKNGCSTSEDRQWLANYKQSDEYKLIYED